MDTIDATRTAHVLGELLYLSPTSTVLRRFTAPGASINTGTYEPHIVPVHDGRPFQHRFRLETNGFVLAEHRSAVADFTDREEVDRVYVREATDFVRSFTGADEVAPTGWVLRRSAAPGENSSQPQAANVHVDYSPEGAMDRAREVYAKHFPDGPGFTRALATSFWRVFSPPPQDWPLAICDFTSVGDDEGRSNRLYFTDTIPEDPFAEMDPDAPGVSGSEFHHSPDHVWWYFPGMTRDEVLFFTLNDTDRSRAWRVPHSAFRDPTVTASAPRHSIELRSFAFFR